MNVMREMTGVGSEADNTGECPPSARSNGAAVEVGPGNARLDRQNGDGGAVVEWAVLLGGFRWAQGTTIDKGTHHHQGTGSEPCCCSALVCMIQREKEEEEGAAAGLFAVLLGYV